MRALYARVWRGTVPREIVGAPQGVHAWFAMAVWMLGGPSKSTAKDRLLSSQAGRSLLFSGGISRGQMWLWAPARALNALRDLAGKRPLLFTGALFLAAQLPFSGGHNLWTKDAEARDFLYAMWQVTAGTLGIVVAAVLFLYEAYRTTGGGRHGFSLQEYSREANIASLIARLFASLILTGAVVLGWGDGAPRGWGAALAIAAAAYALVAIPRTFIAMSRMIGWSEVLDLRKKYMRNRVAESVSRDLRHHRMMALLNKFLDDEGTTISYFTPGGEPVVVTARTGTVVDVDMRRLKRALAQWPESPRVRLPLLSRVMKGTILVSVDASETVAKDDFLVMDTARRVRERADDAYLRELHHDALESIRQRREIDLGAALDVYEELLSTILTYDGLLRKHQMMSITKETDLLERPRRDLYRQFRECLQVGNETNLRAVGWFPIFASRLAADHGRPDLVIEFIKLAGLMAEAEVEHSA